MADGQDKRVYKRVPYSADILVNHAILVKGIDISAGGLYVHTGRSFPSGSQVTVTLPLGERKLTFKALVQHNESGVGMGLKFIDLTKDQQEALEKHIAGAEQKTEAGTAPKSDKKKILLVEDNEMSRRMNKSKLMLEGYIVIEAGSGIEAIKQMENDIPDLVILDLYMEQMDGFKVLALIRQSPKWKDIPVVIWSAKGTPDIIEKAISGGANEFLLKMMTSPVKLAGIAKKLLEQK